MAKEDFRVFGVGDACKFMGIGYKRLGQLLKRYEKELPCQETSSGKIFFKKDVEAFQETRRKKGLIG